MLERITKSVEGDFLRGIRAYTMAALWRTQTLCCQCQTLTTLYNDSSRWSSSTLAAGISSLGMLDRALAREFADDHQRREKASKSNPGRDIYLLLGVPGQHKGLLHLRANITPSSEIVLFLHGPRAPYSGRWHTETSKQVPWQLCGKLDGRNILSQVYEQR